MSLTPIELLGRFWGNDPNNPWDLYRDHPQFAAATADLNASIEHAVKLATWGEARAYMERAQERWAAVGADDSEPRTIILDRLDAVFDENGNPRTGTTGAPSGA